MKKVALSAVGVGVLLSGCATQNMKQVEQEFSQQKVAAGDVLERARALTPANPLFTKQATFYVDKKPLPTVLDPVAQLPPVFKKDTNFNAQTTLPLSEVLARLNKVSGLMFTVAQDVYESDPSRVGTNLSRGAQQADSTSARPGAPVPAAAAAAAGGGSAGGGRVDVMVSDLIYNGNFAGLLDVIATKTNLAWRYDGERVHFFRYDTRIFRIEALAGSAKTSSKVSSSAQSKAEGDGGGGSSASVSTGQETSMDSFADVWADVSTSLQSMLSPRGKMSLLPSTGQVTVTDTPDQLRRVEAYIRDLNKALSKQVAFNVDIYSVEVRDTDNYGLDWSAVWQTLSAKYGLGFQSTGNTLNAGNLFSINVLNGPWTGTNALFGALSSVGRTTLVTSTSMVTLNNIPVPVAVTTEKAYLKEQQTTVAGSSGTAQTSLKPGVVTTGFNMNLTPRLSETDRMMLQFSMDLSDLIDIATFTSPDGKAAIQLPQRNVRNFLQRVSMKSGQTLILSGFQQSRADSQRSGLGNADNWAAGGKRNATGNNTTLVVVITPYIMNQ